LILKNEIILTLEERREGEGGGKISREEEWREMRRRMDE
jgi:hypothetical protein